MTALSPSQSALVVANQRLAYKLANVYGKGSEDAASDAMEGLCIAAAKYDPSTGVPFGAYAAPWIRAKVTAGNRCGRVIHTNNTRAGRALFGVLPTVRKDLEARGEDVTPDTIARETGLNVDDVRAVIRAVDGVTSITTPTGAEDGSTVGDLLSDDALNPEDDYSTAEQTERAHRLVLAFAATLKPETLAWAIWHENLTVDSDNAATLETLGARFGVSKQRASQIVKRLRTDFRAFCEAQGFAQ